MLDTLCHIVSVCTSQGNMWEETIVLLIQVIDIVSAGGGSHQTGVKTSVNFHHVVLFTRWLNERETPESSESL